MEFAYDGGGVGVGKGGVVNLYLDGDKTGEGRVERTHWDIFSMDETAEVGSDAEHPGFEDYGPHRTTPFNGKVTGSRSRSRGRDRNSARPAGEGGTGGGGWGGPCVLEQACSCAGASRPVERVGERDRRTRRGRGAMVVDRGEVSVRRGVDIGCGQGEGAGRREDHDRA
jgi:hypothetical protein